MKLIALLGICIICESMVNSLDVVCPKCDPEAGCRPPCSDCEAPNGQIIQAPIKIIIQPIPPIGCEQCKQNCLSWRVRCKAPTKCTYKQLEDYGYCPKCGACELNCDCVDRYGTLYVQRPRPTGCSDCTYGCPHRLCPSECTEDQLENNIKCATCRLDGCANPEDCKCEDANGYILSPRPTRPPSRNIGQCPTCPTICETPIEECSTHIKPCTQKQLKQYVPWCPSCESYCKKAIDCDCTVYDGTVLTRNSLQQWRQPICPKCDPKVCNGWSNKCYGTPEKCILTTQLQQFGRKFPIG